MFAFWSSGKAQIAGRDFQTALQNYVLALEVITLTRVVVEFETEIRIGLAECHFRLGDYEKAVQAAEQALARSRQRNNRLAECMALLVCGLALKRDDATSASRAADCFAQAQQLINQTGAAIFESELESARAA